MSWKVGQEAVFIYAENPYYKTLIGQECLDGKDSLGCFFFQLAPLVPDTDFKDEEVEDEITVEAA